MSKRLLFLLMPLMLLTSCDKYLNRSFMLRTPDNYPFATFDDLETREYRIGPNDVINARIYANNGFQMVNVIGGASGAQQGTSTINLKVEFDGFAKMPVVGRIYLAGLTARQAELLLEDKFSEYLNKPFVLLEVTNKRITVFMGSNTKVITLKNDNTTLLEALAESGGLPTNAKADRIKLIRGNLRSPDVYMIDLSTLDGMKSADLVLQANDIVYVDLRKEYVAKSVAQISSYLAPLTLALQVVMMYVTFRQIQ